MLGYFCSVPLPTPLRAPGAQWGARLRGTRLPSVELFATAEDFVRRGTAEPSAPPEAGCARDDNSRERVRAPLGMTILERMRDAALKRRSTLPPKGGPSTPPETGSARDDRSKENAGSAWGDNRMGRAGLQASVQAASQIPSTLPKASAQSARTERHRETAGPSARAEALGRDDKFLGGRGTRA